MFTRYQIYFHIEIHAIFIRSKIGPYLIYFEDIKTHFLYPKYYEWTLNSFSTALHQIIVYRKTRGQCTYSCHVTLLKNLPRIFFTRNTCHWSSIDKFKNYDCFLLASCVIKNSKQKRKTAWKMYVVHKMPNQVKNCYDESDFLHQYLKNLPRIDMKKEPVVIKLPLVDLISKRRIQAFMVPRLLCMCLGFITTKNGTSVYKSQVILPFNNGRTSCQNWLNSVYSNYWNQLQPVNVLQFRSE